MFSGTALAHAYIMTPKRPNDTGIMQVRRCCWKGRGARCPCGWLHASKPPHHARVFAGLLTSLSPPACPAPPSGPWSLPPPQAWLQEFAWTEAELPQRLRERQSTLAHADSSRHRGGQEDKAALMAELAQEPMFCFEVRWLVGWGARCGCGRGDDACLLAVLGSRGATNG